MSWFSRLTGGEKREMEIAPTTAELNAMFDGAIQHFKHMTTSINTQVIRYWFHVREPQHPVYRTLKQFRKGCAVPFASREFSTIEDKEQEVFLAWFDTCVEFHRCRMPRCVPGRLVSLDKYFHRNTTLVRIPHEIGFLLMLDRYIARSLLVWNGPAVMEAHSGMTPELRWPTKSMKEDSGESNHSG